MRRRLPRKRLMPILRCSPKAGEAGKIVSISPPLAGSPEKECYPCAL